MTAKRRRVFFALLPDAASKQAIAHKLKTYRVGLPQDVEGRMRWTKPDNWHVTLRFIGEVDEPTATALAACLPTVLPHAPAGVRFTQIEAFPSAKHPRVVALTGPATPPLRQLVDSVDTACSRAGVEPERQPWRCHLTVARPRGRSALHLPLTHANVSFPVASVQLLESISTPGGVRYLPLQL